MFLDNRKKVKYNYCSKNETFSYLKHHFAGTGYDSEPCVSIPEEVKVLMNLLGYEFIYFNIVELVS